MGKIDHTKLTEHKLYVMLHMILENPDSKVHGANMGPIWGRQDPGGPHVGPMNFAIWDVLCICCIHGKCFPFYWPYVRWIH